MTSSKKFSRRQFLRTSTGFLLNTTAASCLSTLYSVNALAQQSGNDYKALVCVLLAGGNDSFNMLVPNEESSFNHYKSLRTNIALEKGKLLPIKGMKGDSQAYGLHPSLPGLQSLFKGGKLAFLNNVGTLLEPIDQAAIASNTWRKPLGLYSHSDQIAQWQTALSDERRLKGWGGRMSDLLHSRNTRPDNPMAYAIDTTGLYLSGIKSDGYTISKQAKAPGIPDYRGEGWQFPEVLTKLIDKQLGFDYPNVLTNTLAKRTRTIIDTNLAFTDAINQSPPVASPFADDSFSSSMKAITQTIAARKQLGMNRQLFYVVLDEWDHHDNLLEKHASRLSTLDKGITAFQNAVADQGLEEQVTTFTISDFARTLTSNGNGSDHGWGGHQFIVGGAIQGGRMYGEYPDLSSKKNPLLHDPERGTFIPTTASDEYFAELALWFGVSPTDLTYVLPNINRFYKPSEHNPIGFTH